MEKYVMLMDIDRCIGCMSCEVACKQEKSLFQEGPRPIKVLRFEHYEEEQISYFMPMNCFHCDVAPCVYACPTSAMTKRDDGLVFVRDNLCIGCKACVIACPFGAISFNPETEKVVKCDFCINRLEKGLLPSCVTKCTTNCLYFVKIDYPIPQKHISKNFDVYNEFRLQEV
jgi:NADH-dependent fumarate reductase subunit E